MGPIPHLEFGTRMQEARGTLYAADGQARFGSTTKCKMQVRKPPDAEWGTANRHCSGHDAKPYLPSMKRRIGKEIACKLSACTTSVLVWDLAASRTWIQHGFTIKSTSKDFAAPGLEVQHLPGTMTRILALHGVGSSGAILRDQLAPLAETLGQDYEFIYLDGAVERARGPGMAPYYPGPFYSYVTGYSPAEIYDAFDDLEEFIEDNGPFDGVIGFSQGASMAASYLLHHFASHPEQPPPFGFAIFLSSVAAFSKDDVHSSQIVQRLLQKHHASIKSFPDVVPTDLSPSESTFLKYLDTTFKVAKKIGAVLPDFDISFFKQGDALQVPLVLHPSLTPSRIKIPTVHFTGKTDLPAMLEQSHVVQTLCDQSLSKVHHHGGGHAAPSRPADVERLAESVQWAVAESASQSAVRFALRGPLSRGVHL
ncbi:hypothetical protein HIM_02966 [Hirsutella minnesotensis 3608]|nr:hypothetical protein HIM_02966 [Hirsutella minnesotensis 3608]